MNQPKVALVITVLAIPLLVAVADKAWTQKQNQTVYSYKSHGVYAAYQYSESAGGLGTFGSTTSRSATVQVREVEQLGTGGTFPFQLNFNISVQYPASYGKVSGFCSLLSNFVTSRGEKQALTLDVDTTKLNTCSVSRSGSVIIPLPVIHLAWERSNDIWNRTEGHTLQEIGDFFIHSQGQSVQNWADVTGSVSMPPISPGTATVQGWIGTNHLVQTQILRNSP